MELLVSVRNAAEAASALAGGADVIDAKDPAAGALGAVSLDTLRAIHERVAGARPVTAALGDAGDEASIARDARAFVDAGARYVKVGFAGVCHEAEIAALISAAALGAALGAAESGAVAVAYADAPSDQRVPMNSFISVASSAGAAGVLLDTIDKHGPGLLAHITPAGLADWVQRAHAAGLFVALAGKLTLSDLAIVRDAGADIAGVRGAACDHGRLGRVTVEKVRALRALCD